MTMTPVTDKADSVEAGSEREQAFSCPLCNGGGEVLANTVRWEQRCEGAFAVCPDCKGNGRFALNTPPVGMGKMGGGE